MDDNDWTPPETPPTPTFAGRREASRVIVDRGKIGREDVEEVARLCWEYGYRSIRDVVRTANFAQGDVNKAHEMLMIMAARTPPTDMTRSRGWRPRK
jgi:hypothetical protein